MASVGTSQTQRVDVAHRVRSFVSRFPRGLALGQEDLAVIGWLYFFEVETASQGVSDSQLKWLIQEATRQMDLDLQTLQSAQLIQRLMRLGILRMTIAEGARRGYRLTSFGQNLARHFMDTTDYSSEQLNVLLGCALMEIQGPANEDAANLLRYLKHAFLGTIREKLEYKLLAIEDDLEERKKEVKRTYSGTSQCDFEDAIGDIEYCRRALTELVDAVRESSACVDLEEKLHQRMDSQPNPDLYEVLEQSVNFLYLLRGRVDSMLKDVVAFIRDCVAYGSLALTVDSRDRLCRTQERILTHALQHDLRMPVLDTLRLPRMDLSWSRNERNRPFILDPNKLLTLDSYSPPELPAMEPDWKDALLHLARGEWKEHAQRGEVDLSNWLTELTANLPEISESLWLALWFLSQDWPHWTPRVSTAYRTGEWVVLGEEWMMEAISLIPVP